MDMDELYELLLKCKNKGYCDIDIKYIIDQSGTSGIMTIAWTVAEDENAGNALAILK